MIGKKISVLAVALVALSLVMGLGRPRASTRQPNIIVISVDALRPDHLGCGGYHRETSPSLDAMASRGVRFSTAISQATWTLPSVASLFLSQYVSTHGVEHPTTRIPPGSETVAEIFRASSYRTAAFVMGGYTSADFGMDQGFDVFGTGDGYAESKFTRLFEWIDSLEGPFFAYVHLPDVHHPYDLPNPYRQSFGARYTGTVTGNSALGRKHAADYGAEDIQHLVDLYDDEVSSVDRRIGMFFEALEERQLDSATVVIVTADHGEAFAEHEHLMGHRGPPYEEQIQIPLLVVGPGIPAGKTIDAVVESIDIAPTILSLAGLAVGSAMQGESLVPLWTGKVPAGSEGFSESIVLNFAAMRTPRWKLIRDTNSGSQALYDLESDPREQVDVSERYPEIVVGLTRRIDDFLVANREKPRFPPATATVSRDTEDRLKALGYVEEIERSP